MKTKRTLISIVVFLSAFCFFILLGFYKLFTPTGITETPSNILSDNSESSLDAISDYYGNTASNNVKLYNIIEGSDNFQADENTNGIDGSISQISIEDKSLENSDTDKSENKNDISEGQEPGVTNSIYSDIGISIAKSYVNIRAKATTDSKVLGKLHKDYAAKILDTAGDWYYIESGSVKGYVKSKYIKTCIPDDELIKKYGTLRISVKTDGLNVRSAPDIASEKLAVVYKNELYPVVELKDDWVKIEVPDDKITGYVNKDYVELLVKFKEAISTEEEVKLKKQQESKTASETEIKYREAFNYTDEELKLLACLVHAEAGNQSYEGKLAVANVVLNRVKSGKYPDTIKAVIYQPGQFSVASSGALKKQLSKYDNYHTKSQLMSIKAAKAALSGINNIGNRLYFNGYKAAAKKGYNKKKNCIKIQDHLFW